VSGGKNKTQLPVKNNAFSWLNNNLTMCYNPAMFGFLDESGEPGVANNENDYLVVSLVIFESREAADKCSASIDRLRKRLGLPDNYEFKISRNSNKVKKAFTALMVNLNFRTITVALRKNDFKKTASYARIAEYFTNEVIANFENIRILQDSNPVLNKELNIQLKKRRSKITIKMARSHSDNLLQLADYIVGLSAKKLKGTGKAVMHYKPFIKKQIYFGEIS